MSRQNEVEMARAQERYYHDRVALLRAKLYRRGVGPSTRLRQLEGELRRAQQRLSELLSRRAP